MGTPPPPPIRVARRHRVNQTIWTKSRPCRPIRPAPNRRSRRLVIAAVVAAVVVVLGACTAPIGAVRLVGAVDEASADGRDRARVDDACRALEVRLNRVAPPGPRAGPHAAAAIRNENAAVKPFLDELRRVRRARPGRRRRPAGEQVDGAVEPAPPTRTRSTGRPPSGAPAFFVDTAATTAADPVIERLEGRVRRLFAVRTPARRTRSVSVTDRIDHTRWHLCEPLVFHRRNVCTVTRRPAAKRTLRETHDDNGNEAGRGAGARRDRGADVAYGPMVVRAR